MSNFDEALERFHLAELEYGEGLSSHGPMGAEALESLRHPALIPAFLDLYAPRLPPARPGSPIDPAAEESALGRADWSSEWVATFEAKLARGDWRAVLSNALPELLPGLFAAAGHGMLRTAHAVRSLEREDSPLRRRELARGLAHWAARFQRLPGLPGSQGSAGWTAEQLFSELDQIGENDAPPQLFYEAARGLERTPGFARHVEKVPRPEPGTEATFLAALCRIGAECYLDRPDERIAYVHLVTLPSTFATLLPFIEDDTLRNLSVLYVLQAMAALHAIQAPSDSPRPEPDVEVLSVSEDWNEIRYRAACSIQEHAIKMAEACFRQDPDGKDAVFRLAAADAAVKLEGARTSGRC